jgi:hypothetical protein
MIGNMNSGNGRDGSCHEQGILIKLMDMIQNNPLCHRGVLAEFVFERLDKKKPEEMAKQIVSLLLRF